MMNLTPLITRSPAWRPDANFFEYYLATDGRYKSRRGQFPFSSQILVEQFATIEHVYPFDESIHTKGVAMIAIEAESITVNSLSEIFNSVVPVYTDARDWSDDAATSNPAALRRHVLLGQETRSLFPARFSTSRSTRNFSSIARPPAMSSTPLLTACRSRRSFSKSTPAAMASPFIPRRNGA